MKKALDELMGRDFDHDQIKEMDLIELDTWISLLMGEYELDIRTGASTIKRYSMGEGIDHLLDLMAIDKVIEIAQFNLFGVTKYYIRIGFPGIHHNALHVSEAVARCYFEWALKGIKRHAQAK